MIILTIVGARPQFVKAAIVSREIKKKNKLYEVIVHTGQHFDRSMSEIFFQDLEISEPDHNLGVNRLSHGAMTGQMLEKIEKVILTERPDWVLVYGDTNSTLAGALAAKKLHIRVAHVEAGLRSFNITMPEEINRILTDRISDLLFCPTEIALSNLEKEGFKDFGCKFENVGDVMQDAALIFGQKAKRPESLKFNDFALCTIHREENTDNKKKITSILKALTEASQILPIVLPLHPRTKIRIKEIGYNFKQGALSFIEPVGYLEMAYLLKNCQLVLTDSGGVQKEAYFFKKMCLTLREETEWMELVENGYNFLCGTNKENIVHLYRKLLNEQPRDFEGNLYGDGSAAKKIIESLINY
jgi:UDP-GlcNAc3NAcA epimerase